MRSYFSSYDIDDLPIPKNSSQDKYTSFFLSAKNNAGMPPEMPAKSFGAYTLEALKSAERKQMISVLQDMFIEYSGLSSADPRSKYLLYESSESTSEAPIGSKIKTGRIDESASKTLLGLMHDEYYESGEILPSETFIREISNKHGWLTTQYWLQKFWLDNYHDPHILIGLLHALSHFRYQDVEPGGVAIALGVLQHEDMSVRDYAIKAFENWNSKQALPILKTLSCEALWLQEYVDKVIAVLEAQGVD